MEARGFIFAPALVYRLNAGFVPVRKPGKLPAECVKYDYALEYGSNSPEIHKDAIQKGQRVLIVDDLLATGGTAEDAAKLVERLEAKVAGLGFVVELEFLKCESELGPFGHGGSRPLSFSTSHCSRSAVLHREEANRDLRHRSL